MKCLLYGNINGNGQTNALIWSSLLTMSVMGINSLTVITAEPLEAANISSLGQLMVTGTDQKMVLFCNQTHNY
jgi:hypothetical protein